MKTILGLGLILGAVWVGLSIDEVTALYLINNAMWVLIVLIMAAIIFYLISCVVRLNKHEITYIDNRSWTTDNSTTNTTNTAYINQAEPSRIGVNNAHFLTSGD